jgi:hypothetical protein
MLENPQIKAQLARVGFEAFASTPEELDAFVKDSARHNLPHGAGGRHRAGVMRP